MKESELIKRTDKKEMREKMVKVLGDISLDEDEQQYLSLGPEFAQFDMVDEEKITVDFLMATTKIRWSRMGKDKE